MHVIKHILLWLWQLPQNIAGWLLHLGKQYHVYYINGAVPVRYWQGNLFYSGVSLGNYILLDYRRPVTERDLRHEYGHQRQSLYLGLLYLPLIGLPSLLGNLYSRMAHKTAQWYYAQPWEHWADTLGGVTR